MSTCLSRQQTHFGGIVILKVVIKCYHSEQLALVFAKGEQKQKLVLLMKMI